MTENEDSEESVLIDVPSACREAENEAESEGYSWACIKAEVM